MIVQFVEPDFLDSIDAFNKTQAKKIKGYVRVLVDHIEQSETIEDLRQIALSNLTLAKSPRLHVVGGRRAESLFPNGDVYLFRFDGFKLYFCLRGQVCTLLRVETNG